MSQTDRSRFTHHPHTLNARTHAHARTARSFACAAAKQASPRASKRRRTRARSPQPSQGEAKSSLLHRDRDGRQAACANENARKARQRHPRQSIPRTPQRGAGRAGYYSSQFPLGHTLCMYVACRSLLFASPTVHTACCCCCSPNHHHDLPSIGCLHMHYEFKADGRAGGSFAHAPVRDIPIVLRAAALSWCDL